MFAMPKAAGLNELVQGGQLYWAFPFSKGSLVILFNFKQVADQIWLVQRPPHKFLIFFYKFSTNKKGSKLF